MDKYNVKLINDDNDSEKNMEFSSMDDISKYLLFKRDEHICKLFVNEEEVI